LKLINAGSVNNWDLIDVSAPYLGSYLLDKPDPLTLLTKLAKSKNLWNQRASIMLTWTFIRKGSLDETFEIVRGFLTHQGNEVSPNYVSS